MTLKTEITDKNFNDKFKKFFQANPNSWRMMRPVERRQGDEVELSEVQCQAWFSYLKHKNMHRRLKVWRHMLGGLGRSVIVPAERPELFDLFYCP